MHNLTRLLELQVTQRLSANSEIRQIYQAIVMIVQVNATQIIENAQSLIQLKDITKMPIRLNLILQMATLTIDFSLVNIKLKH